jgi:hypothetical protein
MPRSPQRETVPSIVINRYIDLVWKDKKPVVFVAGKEFRHCSFLAVTVPSSSLSGARGIDEIASMKEARSLEGVEDVNAYLHKVGALAGDEQMTPEEIMKAHASNLQAWVENDYNTEILNSNISFPLLRELAKIGDEKARRVLESEVDERAVNGISSTRKVILETSPEYLTGRGWEAISKDKDQTVRDDAVSSKYIDGKSLAFFSKDPSQALRMKVAENKKLLPETMLAMIGNEKDFQMYKTLLMNENATPEVLEAIVNDETKRGRWDASVYAAGREDLPVEMIEKLDSSGSKNIIRRLAANPATPTHLLEKYAKDDDRTVRMGVAANEATPEYLLEALKADEDATVRTLAENNTK